MVGIERCHGLPSSSKMHQRSMTRGDGARLNVTFIRLFNGDVGVSVSTHTAAVTPGSLAVIMPANLQHNDTRFVTAGCASLSRNTHSG